MPSKIGASRWLGACSAGVLAFCMAPAIVVVGASPAAAQDYTSGAVVGVVTDAAGAPVQGASVVISSSAQGFTRSATTSANGEFRFPGLPPGAYRVAITGAYGLSIEQDMTVSASRTTDYSFVLAPEENEIVVTARRNLEFSNTTTGVNVDLTELTRTVPIGRSIADVAQLAPTATSGDSTFGNLPSIGGSSVAENAYYVNGLNITNFDRYLGSAPVPFEFFQSIDVKTGGYQAEFGRATGGVITAVTKAGGNDWTGALHINWEPEELAEQAPDTYLDRNGLDERSLFSTIIEGGGPIIRDHLFVYGLAEFQDERLSDASIAASSVDVDESDDPIWALKVDAFPTDDHHLELTYFDTSSETRRRTYAFDPLTDSVGAETGTTQFLSGGQSYILKYTGSLTDWLTISGAYGVTEDRFEVLPTNNGNLVTDNTTAGGGAIISSQTIASIQTPYETRREFYRADVDIYFDLFGRHHVRAGFDHEINTLNRVTVGTGPDAIDGGGIALAPGGVSYSLLECAATTDQCVAAGLAAGATYVEVGFANAGGVFEGQNTAYYIQDEWSITDRFTANLGLRLDQFANYRADGARWLDLDEAWGPRLGFSFDVFGDGGTQLFGHFGRYFLPVASNTSFAFFGSGILFSEFWETDGTFGAGNVPTLTDQIVGYNGAANCPFPLLGAGGQNCNVVVNGAVPAGETFVSHNLEPSEEEEFILGLTHRLGEHWTFGVTYTHRELLTIAEDSAIDVGVVNYCVAQGIAGCDAIWTGFTQYVMINPGSDVTITLNNPINGETDLRTVTLTAAELGYPRASREYDAVEFTFEREFDGVWYLRGSYTWSNSEGNSEGFVQSDYGQDGPGITIDFDQVDFTEGAYGHLPNHREHQFKLWGAYQITPNFLVGANMSVTSPRQFSCLGNHRGGYDGTNPGAFYGHYAHYCLGRLQPRGTGLDGAGLEGDWITNVDVSLRYNFELPGGAELMLRADIFNIFNADGVTDIDEYGENDFNSATLRPQYGSPIGYQRPRYFRLGLDVAF